MARLEAGLARLAALLGGDPGAPGAGAAGGTGYGFAAAWGAGIVPGAPEVCRIAGLDRALAGADLVITGEGRYDQTSPSGKVAGTVLAAAAAAGVPAVVVAGQHGRAAPAAGRRGGHAGGPGRRRAGRRWPTPARWLPAGRAAAGRRAAGPLAAGLGRSH